MTKSKLRSSTICWLQTMLRTMTLCLDLITRCPSSGGHCFHRASQQSGFVGLGVARNKDFLVLFLAFRYIWDSTKKYSKWQRLTSYACTRTWELSVWPQWWLRKLLVVSIYTIFGRLYTRLVSQSPHQSQTRHIGTGVLILRSSLRSASALCHQAPLWLAI